MIAAASLAGWGTDIALVLPPLVFAWWAIVRAARRRDDRAWDAMWGPSAYGPARWTSTEERTDAR